jgi:hypothetical protein
MAASIFVRSSVLANWAPGRQLGQLGLLAGADFERLADTFGVAN